MYREWIAIVGIMTGLGFATGGYEILKRFHAPVDGLFSVRTLVSAAGEFLMLGGVLLALLLLAILLLVG
jgi:hypothetical protein